LKYGKNTALLAAASAMLALGACASRGDGSWVGAYRAAGTLAQAQLQARSGSSVSGRIAFREDASRVIARFEISGLRPGSEHGFHVHEKGDCSAADATSAGGHFNPGKGRHGHHALAGRHAGDMPNLRADSAGIVRGEITLADLTLDRGTHGIIGRSIVIHRDPDDYQSQPAGNSGPRIACGVIVASK
jgi:Cu-Zn family superoxide dismutase